MVYDALSSDDMLTQYAKRYHSVEVDQWFWSLGKNSYGLPDASVALSYDRATDAQFRFTIKCPNALTLPYAYGDADTVNPYFLDAQVFYRFLERLGPLVKKVGLFMFQFAYFNQKSMQQRSQFEQKLEKFITLLPDSLPYAVEVRNPLWIDASWFDFLTSHAIAPVLLSGYWMDSLSKSLQQFAESGGNTLCIRLHGDDRSAMERKTEGKWDKLVQNKDEELASIAPLLVELAKQGRVVYINVNNHYEGSAPLTIEKLVAYLGSVYE